LDTIATLSSILLQDILPLSITNNIVATIKTFEIGALEDLLSETKRDNLLTTTHERLQEA